MRSLLESDLYEETVAVIKAAWTSMDVTKSGKYIVSPSVTIGRHF